MMKAPLRTMKDLERYRAALRKTGLAMPELAEMGKATFTYDQLYNFMMNRSGTKKVTPSVRAIFDYVDKHFGNLLSDEQETNIEATGFLEKLRQFSKVELVLEPVSLLGVYAGVERVNAGFRVVVTEIRDVCGYIEYRLEGRGSDEHHTSERGIGIGGHGGRELLGETGVLKRMFEKQERLLINRRRFSVNQHIANGYVKIGLVELPKGSADDGAYLERIRSTRNDGEWLLENGMNQDREIIRGVFLKDIFAVARMELDQALDRLFRISHLFSVPTASLILRAGESGGKPVRIERLDEAAATIGARKSSKKSR
ncbi:MAG: hypothetical protein JNL34_08605 [Anaerolineae bacterium]|nr:hypothetical protein [Anaerolineae bacterium]